MRYFIIATCVFLIIQSSAQAQIPVRLGLALGLNLANQSYTPDISSPLIYRPVIIAGTLAEVGISDLLYVQVEPRFIQKGTTIQQGFDAGGPPPGPGPDVVEKLNYLEIPLHLKTKFGTSDFMPFAFVGPTIGVLLSAREEVQEYNIQIDTKDQYNSIDYSLDLGGGVEYRISTSISLVGNACYSFGLSNISNQTYETIHSRGIQIVFSSLFNL